MSAYSDIRTRRVYICSSTFHSLVKPGDIWYTQTEFLKMMRHKHTLAKLR